ncbi:hypothetical protein [Azospirillum sp. B510]|uniref:hypothetical protein n=1 Tax=Azospirillum sp. (strain B510) TaxID=137722 RepID=UPI000304B38B|nr:hypothetical protein [Azospirillum sp. B510]
MSLSRGLMILCMPLPLSPAFADDGRFDLSAVRDIRVVGAPGSVMVTTRMDAPLAGTITQRRQGWVGRSLSFWSHDDCGAKNGVRLDGDTLVVTIASGTLSSCHHAVTANMR